MNQEPERGLSRRRFISTGAGAGAALFLAACGSSSSSGSSSASSSSSSTASGPVTLNNLFQQQAGYSASDLAGMTASFEKAYPHIKVNNTLVAYEALHDKIVAAAPAGTYDVVLGDVIWPAEFGSKGIVQDITSRVSSLPTSQIFPGALVMANYRGKYYGMPWILDTKYLYANGKMLKAAGVSPSQLRTWSGVVAAMKQIKAKGIVKYPLLGSWSQAEAVVCDYAQLLGAFGGKFLDGSGKPTFQSGGGLTALTFMKTLIDEGLADPASTSSLEADVLKAFAQGKIAMGLNWTFQLAASLDPKQSTVSKDDVMIMHTPAGTGGAAPGCNGGQPLMITSGTKHPDEAWALHQVDHQPVGSEPVRGRLTADLGGVLHRPAGGQGRRRPARLGGQDAAAEHDPSSAGDQLQLSLPGPPGSDSERAARAQEPAGRAQRGRLGLHVGRPARLSACRR